MDDYQQFFTGRPTPQIARDLLGHQLIYHGPQGDTGGLIVETEAYLGTSDPASHAYGGRRTGYTESLYGHPGDIYVYQIRSHYCFDVVVQPVNDPQGILIRALEPDQGMTLMATNRRQRGVNISNGPGKLMQALGISDRHLDGQSLATAPLTINLAAKRLPKKIIEGPRVGINPHGATAQQPLRFYVAQNPYVSHMRQSHSDRIHHGWES